MNAGRGNRGRGRGGAGGGRGSSGGHSGTVSFTSGSAGGGGRAKAAGRGRGRGRGSRGGGRGGGKASSTAGNENSKPQRSWSSDKGAGGRGAGGGRGKGKGGGGNGGRGGAEDGLPANKKRRLKMERQQHRPEFDTVLRSKEIWNKLRERKVPQEQRKKLVQELLHIIKGKVLAISMKHDASRVVQTAIQFGSQQERLSILAELESHLVELSQLTYAHFIVLRLFKESKGKDEQKRVAKAFKGQTVKLATHAIGARVIQSALDSLPSTSAALIKAEFYGKEFALFDDGQEPHSLARVLEARPDRRSVVMSHVYGVITRILSKGLMQFEFAHELLWEYIQQATPLQMQELVPQLVESFMVLLSTRPGSMSAAMCAAHGAAKERKRMMRALKGYVASSLMHRDAYVAVMRLVESVDDTITCQKIILAELLKPLEVGPEDMRTAEGVPKPGKGTSAEEWVPRGNTAPKAAQDGENGKDGDAANDDQVGPGSMDVDEDVPEAAEGEGGEEEEGSNGAMEDDEGQGDEAEGKEDVPSPPALVAVMQHRNGCKLLLRLLAPEHTGYLHPEELELLKPTMIPASAPAKGAGAKSSDKDEVSKTKEENPAAIALIPSSRKDASVRRRELLAFLREPLREACASHAGELMRSKFAGALVLVETVRAIGTPQLVQALVEAACAKPLEMQLPMHEDPAGHLFMKQLLKREAEAQRQDKDGDAGPAPIAGEAMGGAGVSCCFADALAEQVGDGLVKWASSNRGAFVVAALEEVPSAKKQVRSILQTDTAKASLVKAARDGNLMGPKVLAEQLGFGDFGAKAASTDRIKSGPKKKK